MCTTHHFNGWCMLTIMIVFLLKNSLEVCLTEVINTLLWILMKFLSIGEEQSDYSAFFLKQLGN